MANITAYPTNTTPKNSDLLLGTKVATPGTTEQPTTTNVTIGSLASFTNSYSLGYTVYTALLTQAGAAAPVATVLQNTTGGTIVWTRASTGRYVATIASATYTTNKTSCMVTSGGNNDFMLKPATIVNTAIDFYNLDLSDNAVSDTIAATTTVEIRIYS